MLSVIALASLVYILSTAMFVTYIYTAPTQEELIMEQNRIDSIVRSEYELKKQNTIK